MTQTVAKPEPHALSPALKTDRVSLEKTNAGADPHRFRGRLKLMRWYEQRQLKLRSIARFRISQGEGSSTSAFLRWHAATVLLLVLFCPRAGTALPPSTPRSRVVQLRVVDGHDIHFAHLSTSDGLSEMVVQQVSQDNQGFMWFGTLDGLNRYDGYEFRVRKRGAPNAELGGTTVRALFKDRSGELWIGVDQCLDRFDPTTEKLTEYQHDPKISTSLGGTVYGITQDREGQLWVATSAGLDKLNPSTGIFTHYHHDDRDSASLDAEGSRNDVRFVGVDDSDTLWVETSAGINSFDPKTGKATRFSQLLNHDEFHEQHVYQDRSGRLWIYSREGSGIGIFDPKTGEFVRYKFITGDSAPQAAERVTSVLQDEQGVLWLGIQGNGLLKLDPHDGTAIRYFNDPADPQSLSNNFVLCLYEDREGNIWAGTGGGGINRFSAVPSGFKSYKKRPGEKNSLDQNFVLSVFEDSHSVLWVGNDGVLNRIDSKTGSFRFYRHRNGDSSSISDGTVLSTIEDRAGTLWFASYRGGLNAFDRRTSRFKAYRHEAGNLNSPSSDVIMRLQLDPKGRIWVAADHALDEFDPDSKQFEHYPELTTALAATLVTCFDQDRRGMLWLGTNDAGLVRFDPATRHYDVYRSQPGNSATLSGNRVNALLVDRSGTLWVGTQLGLDKFDVATQQFHAYTEQDGLPSNAVQSILEDQQGKLWVGTDNGLAEFTPGTKSVRSYYASDGLAGSEFNYWGAAFKDTRGEMFFPGVSGLTVFHPGKIAKNRYVPPVVLTDFRLFGASVSPGPRSPLHQAISATKTFTLTHSQNIFSFGFSSLSYAYPERNRYRYMLEGLEHQWNYTDSRRRFGTYTTLAPGEYVFRVQGSNNHGVWNEEGVSIRIRVLPPWWNTWWFRALCVLAFLAMLWTVYRLRVGVLEDRQAILERHQAEISALNERLMKAQEEERIRIAGELHDGVLQKITSLALELATATIELPSDSEPKAEVRQVEKKLIEVGTEIRQLSHELHPAVLQEAGLPAALSLYCEEFGRLRGIPIAYQADESVEELSPGAALCIYRIAQEALGNVAKHAKAKQVQVRLTRSDSRVCLVVSDDGVGFNRDGSGKSGGLGLINMRERVRQLNGAFEFESEPGHGTTVKAEVPFRPAP